MLKLGIKIDNAIFYRGILNKIIYIYRGTNELALEIKKKYNI